MKNTLTLLCVAALPVGYAIAAGSASGGKDTDFASRAAQAGMAEVATGRLAASKGTDAQVKSFGQKMVDDHSAANDELKSAAGKGGYTLPADPTPDQKAAADRLSKLQGAEFDREYAHMAVKDHEGAVALFKQEAAAGKDADLKALAQKTLPALEEHLKMARQLPGGAAKKQ